MFIFPILFTELILKGVLFLQNDKFVGVEDCHDQEKEDPDVIEDQGNSQADQRPPNIHRIPAEGIGAICDDPCW